MYTKQDMVYQFHLCACENMHGIHLCTSGVAGHSSTPASSAQHSQSPISGYTGYGKGSSEKDIYIYKQKYVHMDAEREKINRTIDREGEGERQIEQERGMRDK